MQANKQLPDTLPKADPYAQCMVMRILQYIPALDPTPRLLNWLTGTSAAPCDTT